MSAIQKNPPPQEEAPKLKRGADLKIIFLGEASVGKTCMLQYFINGKTASTSTSTEPTIGANFEIKNWYGHNFCIWDTAGQEKFHALNEFYCRNAHAAILVFDLTVKSSFQQLHTYYQMLTKQVPNPFIVLAANKQDLIEQSPESRQVSFDEALAYAKKINAVYLETSAKTGHNIQLVFDKIGEHFFGKEAMNTAQQSPRNEQYLTNKSNHIKIRLHEGQNPDPSISPTPSSRQCWC